MFMIEDLVYTGSMRGPLLFKISQLPTMDHKPIAKCTMFVPGMILVTYNYTKLSTRGNPRILTPIISSSS